MKLYVDQTAKDMGIRAANEIAQRILESIQERGSCRILLSTGASQFPMFDVLTKMDLPWDKVTMFHLDEYVGLPMSHPASFRKYLTERFIDKVHPGEVHLVSGEGDVQANIAELTAALREAPIDIGVIGIGENGHIAFNDPPADIETREAYIVVNLDERCRMQQVGEGWFSGLSDVPAQAISMTVWQILQCRSIVSVVPDERKAEAVQKTLEAPEPTALVPATFLFTHKDWTLFLDADSGSRIDAAKYL